MRPRSVLLVGLSAFLCLAYRCPPIPVLPAGTPPASDVVFQIDSSRDRNGIRFAL